MNAFELLGFAYSMTRHNEVNGRTLVAVEMPDDKSQYAVNGIRYDRESNSVIIEIA